VNNKAVGRFCYSLEHLGLWLGSTPSHTASPSVNVAVALAAALAAAPLAATQPAAERLFSLLAQRCGVGAALLVLTAVFAAVVVAAAEQQSLSTHTRFVLAISTTKLYW
jgi:hypothetical protein